MNNKAANELPFGTNAGGMQPVSSDNVKQSYQPIIPGENIEEQLYDPSKYRWHENTGQEYYVPPFYGKYFKGSAQDPSPHTIQGENQPWLSKLANGVSGNLISVATKAGTMLGEFGGGIYDAITNLSPVIAEERKEKYGTYFPHLFENFVTKGLRYVEEDLIDQKLMPVYGGQKYHSDNLWQKMGDMKFWSSDVADGAAFAAAALLTTKGFGAIARGLGMATKVADAAGKTTSVLTAEGKMFQTIGTTIANTIGEAAYEGADNLRTTRDALAYHDYGRTYENLSPDERQEINQKAAPYAANVFNANSALLLLPNLIQARFFIGPVEDSSKKLMKAIKAGKLKASDVSALRNTIKQGSLGIVSEGLWEEGIQNAVQNYETSKAEGKSFLSRIPGYGAEWLNGWYTTEGQESMFIGALIGAGMGGARGAVDALNNKKAADKYKTAYDTLIKGTMATADNVLIDFKHPYKQFETIVKDTEGKEKTIKSIINPKTGKAELDIDNFIKIIQSDVFNKEVTDNLLMAALNNDKVAEKFILNMAMAQYFYRYASSDMFDKSDEAFKFMLENGKLNELSSDTDLKSLGYDFDYMKGLLQRMKSQWDLENDKLISKKDIDDDSDLYKKFREKVDKAAFYNRVKLSWLDEIDQYVEDKDGLNEIGRAHV